MYPIGLHACYVGFWLAESLSLPTTWCCFFWHAQLIEEHSRGSAWGPWLPKLTTRIHMKLPSATLQPSIFLCLRILSPGTPVSCKPVLCSNTNSDKIVPNTTAYALSMCNFVCMLFHCACSCPQTLVHVLTFAQQTVLRPVGEWTSECWCIFERFIESGVQIIVALPCPD